MLWAELISGGWRTYVLVLVRALMLLGLLGSPALGFAQAAPAAPAPAAAPVVTPKLASEVKLHDSVVFSVLVAHGRRSAQQRAQAASAAIEHARAAEHTPVRVVRQGVARVLFAADTPVIELFQEDAAAAGDASLEVHAARLSARVREALQKEKQRSAIANSVFHASLVVLFGLLSLYALRKFDELVQRARTLLAEHPERVSALRLHSLELIGAAALRALLTAALAVGRWVMLLGIVYVWLLFSLSLFDATEPYTKRLTSFVFTPLTELAGRVLSALPMGLLFALWAAVVYLLVHFANLFFASVTRGETRAAWLPRDLLRPAGLLVRFAIVALGFLFAGPLVTGDAQGALAHAGSSLLLALALACAPLLACAVVGVVQVFGRRLRIGQELSVGGRHGRVLSVGLLDVRLRERGGAEVRVPHLLALFAPLVSAGDESFVQVCVAAGQSASAVRDLLLTAAAQQGERASVELTHFDADGLRFRVGVALRAAGSPGELRIGLLEALTGAGIALGRTAPEPPA